MGRGTGRKGKITTEIGFNTYTKDALTSVTTPAANVNKKFYSSAERFTGIESYQPTVYLDGVNGACNISAGTAADSYDVSSGTYQIKGNEYSLSSSTGNTSLTRPAVDGNIVVNGVSVDTSGNLTVTAGSEGTTSTTRGAAGGPPFIPVDEVLLGYITLSYTSATAGAVVASTEIDNASKEYSYMPGYTIIHHDDGDTDLGCVEFKAALGTIHTGSVTRNVYATYFEPQDYVEISDSKDFTTDEVQATVQSEAYDDSTQQSHMGVESWTGSFDYYFKKAKATVFYELKSNRKRFFKFYPDRDATEHFTGRAVITSISSSAPVSDMIGGTIALEGAGQLYRKSS
jgi:hypothetical protein